MAAAELHDADRLSLSQERYPKRGSHFADSDRPGGGDLLRGNIPNVDDALLLQGQRY